MSQYGTQIIPEGETPTVRLKHDVHGDLIFAATVAPAGVYKAYMNQYGAVSVEASNGKLLGIRPHEMEWVEGKPSEWCNGDDVTYLIEPYEGDWTLDAFEQKTIRPNASTHHIRCHDCGRFIKRELWVPKDHVWKQHALCQDCLDTYDEPDRLW